MLNHKRALSLYYFVLKFDHCILFFPGDRQDIKDGAVHQLQDASQPAGWTYIYWLVFSQIS